MDRYTYIDTSAALKLVFLEPETPEVERLLLETDGLLASRLTEVELERAMKRTRDRRPVQQASEVYESIVFVNITPAITKRAAALPDPNLRSLDAIHLATALSVNLADLEFLTFDARLARAARAHGLTVP